MYDAAAAATAAAADGPHDQPTGGSDSAALTAASSTITTQTPYVVAAPSLGALGQPGGGGTNDSGLASPDVGAPREVVFIDAAVPDREILIEGVRPGERVYLLDPARDGVQQIADILEAKHLSGLSAIQIVSHGFAGEIALGTTILNDSTITRHADALARIGAALQSGGDILLYGCDTAAGSVGARFLADIAALTGANVAAATHDIGAAARGGSWTLDAATGPIEAGLPFTAAALAAYDGLLADTLAAGDIAIIGYNTHQTDTSPATTTDSFSFVLMRDITAGTTIDFTDKGWTGSAFSGFAGDGVFTWTASSDMTAGTVVTPTISGGMSLDDAGDQIIAYQGSEASPTFIYAIDFADGNTTFAGSATNASTSALPTGLTLGTSAVAVSFDSAAYSGITTGTAASLRSDIGSTVEWVGADRTTLNALVQPVQSGPFLLDPDLQVWTAASGGGNGIVHLDADDTISSGTSGYNLVQLLTNANLSVITASGTVSEKLFHPNDIALDTVHDLFFVADSDTTVTGNRILQGNISDLLNNPGATVTVRELYDDPTLTVTSSVSPSITNLVIDPDSRQVYFSHGSRLEKVAYDAVGQSATTLLNLNSKNGIDFVSADNTITNNNITDFVADFATGDIYMTSSRAILGLFSKNYLYHVTGLTSGSGANSCQGSIAVMNFSPDDSDLGQLALLGGEAFPEMKGALGGLAIDTSTHTLYFSTQTVSLDVDGLPITPLVTFRGGIYSYALTGNASGAYTLLYQQTTSSGPQGQFNTDLEIDVTSSRYYASSSAGGVWSGSLAFSTSSTQFGNPTNIDGLAPVGLTLEHAPTLAVTAAGASYVEQQSSPTSVQLISGATANDTDTATLDDQLASATVSITSGFLSGVDQLTINDATSGTLDYGTQDIAYSYDASTGVMTLTGASTFANYQTSLALIRFQASGDNPTSYGTDTSRTISWSVSDGALSSDMVTSTIAVVAVNDAPVNAVPGTQTATEDVAKIITGLSVNDVDADPTSQSLRVTLSTQNGVLTLASIAGLAFTSGDGSTDATMTFSGTANAINAALTSVTYLGNTNFDGSDTVTRTTNDQGHTGTDPGATGDGASEQDQDSITINVGPVSDAPQGSDHTVLANAGTAYHFAAGDFGFSDPDDAPADALAAVRITTLPLSGTLTDNGNAVAAGDFVTIAAINAGLFVYMPGTGGGANYASFQFQVQDSGADQIGSGGVNLDPSADLLTIDVNLPPATPIDIDNAANTVVEGAAVDTLVAVIASATDPFGGTVSYSITADGSGGGFKIDPTTGVISVADGTKIDYESAPGHAYSITVQANDGVGGISSQTFSIGVTDVAPSVPADADGASGGSIAEGAGSGAAVGVTASSTDVSGGVVTFSLSDDAGGRFTIDASTGVVTVANASLIDFETATSHQITVRASDPSGAFNEQSFTIAVTDVAPSAPVDGNAATNTVAEGAANGTAVAGLAIGSADVNGGTVTYALTNDAGGRFAISSSTGEVTVADGVLLDFETATSHQITVRASDPSGAFTEQSFTIAVTDAAPSTPVDTDGASGGSVSEAAANGAALGVTASSNDVNGGAVTYSLSDDAGGRFAIDSSSGIVTVANALLLDFEAATSHQITVRAADASGAFTEQGFTIAVTDVAPATPADNNAAANTIAEGAVNGTAVAGLAIGSADVNGGSVTFSLSDDAGGRFAIDSSTGVVTVADASLLDFETATAHLITVRASDPSGAFTEQSFTIAVTDVAPSTPVDTDGASGGSVSEAASNGATVGVSGSSADVNGGTITYSLSDDAGGRFAIDSSGVVTVADASLLDFESTTSHQITIRASDPSGAFSEQSFTIAVTDAPPSAPADADGASGGSIPEAASNGAAVGITGSSTDVHGGTVTYSLSDDANGRFAIDSSTGVVTVADAALLDFETATSHQITVRASDPSGAFSEQSFTIAVTDAAPSTPADSNAVANTIAEGAANGTAVAGLTIGSADVNGGTVAFSLSDDAGGRFAIDSSTGVVTVANAALLDFETATSHLITVRAADPSGAFTGQSFTIAVTDVAPSVPTDTSGTTGGSVSEAASNGAAVGITGSSTDVNGGAVTYSLSNDAGGRFAIDPSTGVVTVADASLLDFESATSHQITIRASDPTGAFSEQSFSIAVTDAAPSAPADTDGATGGSVSEGASNGAAVGVTVSSTDINGGMVTFSLSDDASGRFAIDSSTGVVTVADATLLDFETATSHQITIRVSNPSGAFTEQSFTIAVTDVAPSTPTDSDAAANTVAEGAANGTAVAGLAIGSVDVNGGTVIFSLSDDASGRFAIGSSTGVVTVADASLLNFESATSHQVTVRASDPSGAFTERSFTISVSDIAPPAPADTDGASGGSVSEAAENGDSVGITASSIDVNGGAVTYVLSDDAGGRFAIDSSGVVTVADASLLDFETATSHQITVRASDPNGAFSEQSFTVAVTDVAPSAPVDSSGATGGSVSEAASNGAAVGVIAVSTDVRGGTVTYSLSNDAGGRFTIDSSTGVVTVADASLLDFETATSHQITVRSSDPSGAFSEESFTIAVTDVAPSTPADSNAAANTIAEGAANGTAVAGLAINSADVNGGTVTFSLSDDAGGRFAIDSSTGVVTVADASLLDFEGATSHQITIRAFDPSGAFTEQSFTIAVTDVAPSTPADSDAAANTISESAANGTAVGGLTIGSVDVNGGTVTFSLSDDAGGRFAIDSSTGAVTVADASLLDFETSISHQITIRASDPNGAFTEQSFTIAVSDVAPSTPADGDAVANTIAEGAANSTVVAGLAISSMDVNGGTVTYTLSNDAGGRFAINSSTGAVTVANGGLLDFETATSHQITVRASDPSGAFTEQSFTIVVTDVAPATPVDSDAVANTIAEGVANGTAVAGLAIGSADVNGGTVTFSLSSDAGGRFAIDSSTGVVTVANASLLDFETATSHQITVRAADPSGAFSEQSFAIAVTDVAPSEPTDADGASGGSVSEAASNGASVGISAASADANGGTVAFSLSNDAGGRFTIDSATGVVTVANASLLNFEGATSHQITVRASDPSGAFSEQSFTIDVTDVAPSAPTDGNAAANTIAEGAVNGTAATGLAIASTDVNDGTVAFALSNDAGGRFTIDSSTGVVTVANASLLDFESATSHLITVRASDPSGAFSEQSFTIDVTDVAPSAPTDSNAAANTIAEGAVNGTAVAGLAIGSADVNGGTVTFALSNDAGGRFTIDSSTGVVTVANASLLDFESATSHLITVRASDPSGAFNEQSFTIDVTDVAPSAPADSNAAANTIAEGAASGTAVAGLTIGSADVNGGMVTFALSNDAGGRFTIDSSTGVVTVANAALLDFESATSHQVTVRASDASGAFSEQSFTIDLTDVAPSAPTDGNAAANTIAEGAVNGSAVAGLTIGSTDINGGAVTYSLSNDAGGRFTIDSSTGMVTVANAALLNFEGATSHQITLRAADPSGAFSEQSFAIAVTDIAPSAPTDTDGASGGTVSEGASDGAGVGIVASSDDINGGSVTYSLSNDAGGRFTVDSSTGVVTVADAALLDFESATSHQITLRASDASGAFSEQSFTIAVIDIAPSAPVDGNAAANVVAEGAANGTPVSGLAIGSTDIHGGTVTYALSNDAGGRFAIDPSTAVVSVAAGALIDFEVATSHQITVRASDPSGAFSEQSFTVAVTNAPPSEPMDNDGAANGIAEGAVNGTVVAGLSLTSSDGTGAVTYSLSEDAGGRFAIDPVTGVVTVADASLLDFETAESHQIIVQAMDDSEAFSEQTFTIAVTDVAPSVPLDADGATGGSISEGAGNGDSVGIAASSNDVNGGAVTYALSNDAGGRFAIDPVTGVVTVADAELLDFETAGSHQITVRATDAHGAFSERSFAIAVTDVPVSAPEDVDPAANMVAEGAADGTVVRGLTIQASDVHGGTVTYVLTDDAGGRFAIDPVTGVVTVANGALLEIASGPYVITVEARDGSSNAVAETFTIGVEEPVEASTLASAPDSSGPALGDTPYPGFSRLLTSTYSPTGFAESGDTALTGDFANYTVTVGGGLYIVRIDAEEEFQPTATVDGDLDFRVPMTAMIAWLGGDVVSITARLAGDQPLPDWLKFDGTTAQFAGRMPDDVVTGGLPPAGSDPASLGGSADPKPVIVEVTGFDTKGNRVILIFSIRPASGATGTQGALSPDLDRWTDRAPVIADLPLHRLGTATEWPGLIRDVQPAGHTPDGRPGLSAQLGALGSGGLAAERLALLESLRQQAARY